MTSSPFSTIEAALEDFRRGRLVIIVDDEDRENEGDLAIAAEKVTPEAINFMAREGRGLICLALTEERCDELQLPLMVRDNTSPYGTAFTVSIEAKGKVSTGISAADRAATILAAIHPATRPEDLLRPGHIFPLRARRGGVLKRAGQTEASVDLAQLAGLHPAGVICEIMNDDGTMARVPDLTAFAARHGLPMITVAELIRYRLQHETLVERVASTRLPTAYGEFHIHAYRSEATGEEHVVLQMGEITGEPDPGARPQPVPDRRRLRLRPLRLRPAAAQGARAHRPRGARRPALPAAGRARHRPAQQAPGLRAPGSRVTTPSRPTRSSASGPTSASTASARRSCATWACAACA